MAHDVFVSYSTKDKAVADTVVSAMENNGIRCWYAPRDIGPGQDWGNAITSAIEESKVFLVIFSNHANRSQRVLDEVNLAISHQAVILPFRIENLEPEGAMKLHLSSRHWLDAYDPSWESHIKKLIMDVSVNLKAAIKDQEITLPAAVIRKIKKQSRKKGKLIAGIAAAGFIIAAGVFAWMLFNGKEQDTALEPSIEISTPVESQEEQETAENETPSEAEDIQDTEIYDAASIEDICGADEYGCAKIEPGDTIKIGMSMPLSGDSENWGIDTKQSGLLAVSDAGDFQDFKFELIAKDDMGTTEGGASAAEELVADPTVVAIAGHTFSGSTEAAVPYYEEYGLPILSYSASNPEFLETGSNVYSQLCYSDKILGFKAAEYIYDKIGARRIAILHSDDDYGKGIANFLKTGFSAAGGEVTAFGNIRGNPDWWTTILNDQTEVVYYCGLDGGADVLELVKSNANREIPFFGCDAVYLDLLNQEEINAEGAYFSTTRVFLESEEKDLFDQKYLKAFGISPGVLSQVTYSSYDSARILTEMVKEVGMLGEDGALYIPRGGLARAVRGLTDYAGISGNYSCGNIGDCNVEGPMILKTVNGETLPAE